MFVLILNHVKPEMSQKVKSIFFIWSQPPLSPNFWLSLGRAFWLRPKFGLSRG